MKNAIISLVTILLVSISLNLSAQTDDPIYYEVKFGNSLKQIAKKYNTTVEQIMEWNNLEDKSVAEGDKLIVGYKGAEEEVKTEVEAAPKEEKTLEDIGTEVEEAPVEEVKEEEPTPEPEPVEENVATIQVEKKVDDLMFCGNVDQEEPVGVSNLFYMGYGEDYLYAFFRQDRSFGIKTIFVRMYEQNPATGEFSHVKTSRFKVKPTWSHAFFRYDFKKGGTYLLKVYDPDDVKLVEGRVTIVKM